MEEWAAMKVMRDAHDVGLQKLDDLGRAVQTLKEGDKAQAMEVIAASLRFFEDDLRMHFRHEEQGLFPALAKVIGRAGPIDAMLQEHDSIWRAIDTFGELVLELKTADENNQAKLVSSMERVAKHVAWLLASHIQKEDSMLFPMAEKMLDVAGQLEVDASVRILEKMYGAAA